MMLKRGMMRQSLSLVLSGFFVIFVICLGLLVTSAGILVLSHVLSYVSIGIFKDSSMSLFHYVLLMLGVTCTAGLAIPIILLARNIQRSTDNFSLLQFDELEEDDDEFEGDDIDLREDDEELNEFLKKLHKNRNIGPFIPSPKTMDDLCPCGSGLKYKDCCGKSWL
jgi:hypothetical protein